MHLCTKILHLKLETLLSSLCHFCVTALVLSLQSHIRTLQKHPVCLHCPWEHYTRTRAHAILLKHTRIPMQFLPQNIWIRLSEVESKKMFFSHVYACSHSSHCCNPQAHGVKSKPVTTPSPTPTPCTGSPLPVAFAQSPHQTRSSQTTFSTWLSCPP